MTTKQEPRLPGPDHPITIAPFQGRVRVSLGDHAIADSTAALRLSEASYPPVLYLPLTDVDPAALLASQTVTYCPYKGEANYYSLSAVPGASDGGVVEDAVWYYATPYPAVGEIAGYAAFYPDKVEITIEPAQERA